MLLALLASLPALAGRLVLEVRNPVVVFVNGELQESPTRGDVLAREDLQGRLRLEARTPRGQALAEATLDLPATGEVLAVYEDGAFRVERLSGGATILAGSAAAPAVRAAPNALARCEASLPGGTAGLVVGVGVAEPVRPPHLPPATRSPRAMEEAQRAAQAAAAEALRGKLCGKESCTRPVLGLTWHAFLLEPEGWACATLAARLDPLAPRAAAASTRLVELLRQDQDWANVYVDGERVAEFRVGDQKRTVPLAPGSHTVEIRDVLDSVTWARGTLVVGPGDTPLRVGFGKSGRVEVYNDPGAWR